MPYRYRANRGGHAPGHLRELFVEQLEQVADRAVESPWEGFGGRVLELIRPGPLLDRLQRLPDDRARWAWLLGQLWDCTDILPWESIEEVEAILDVAYPLARREPPSTYGRAARRLKEQLAPASPGHGPSTTQRPRCSDSAMIFYHRTTPEAAAAILAGGFRGAEGTWGTGHWRRGVWISDTPLDENEGTASGLCWR